MKIIADFETVERMAADLCHLTGGKWSRKRTKKNLWRKRVLVLIAMANDDEAEVQRIKRGGAVDASGRRAIADSSKVAA